MYIIFDFDIYIWLSYVVHMHLIANISLAQKELFEFRWTIHWTISQGASLKKNLMMEYSQHTSPPANISNIFLSEEYVQGGNFPPYPQLGLVLFLLFESVNIQP